MTWCVALFICVNGLLVVSGKEYRRVCYYTNWSQHRADPWKFFPQDVDPYLCTHIIYAFAQVDPINATIKPSEENDIDVGYPGIQALKTKNPSLQTLLAVGGWEHGSAPFMAIVANETLQQDFIWNTLSFLRFHGFDGIDYDWEYPAARGSPPEDKYRFTKLVTETREACELESQSSGKPRLLVAAAVGAGPSIIGKSYEIAAISKQLDFINLMSYDYHGSWESSTGHNSPLYSVTGQLYADWSVDRWMALGVPKEKLNMGMGAYGRTFKLQSPTNHYLGSATNGAGNKGQYTGEAGFLSYFEICNNNWTRTWDEEHKVPYKHRGNQWVGYDDVTSFALKANYIKQKGLGGAMFWSIDLDDFKFAGCSDSKEPYPLLNTVKSILTSVPPGGEDAKQNDVSNALDPEKSRCSSDKASGGEIVIQGRYQVLMNVILVLVIVALHHGRSFAVDDIMIRSL